MSPLAEYLAILRAEYCYAQAKFGGLIGLAGSHVSVIELGQRYAPPIEALGPLISGLNLSEQEQQVLEECASLSPRRLRIPPSAPAEAFSFIAVLDACWLDISTSEFESMQRHLLCVHRTFLNEMQAHQSAEIERRKP